jgi:hypothetical protein
MALPFSLTSPYDTVVLPSSEVRSSFSIQKLLLHVYHPERCLINLIFVCQLYVENLGIIPSSGEKQSIGA